MQSYTYISQFDILHYGVPGMKWGVRKSDRDYYVTTRRVRYKLPKMSKDEYVRACDLWNKNKEISMPQREKERVYEEFDNNLSTEEKETAIVSRAIDSNKYVAINKGHNQYKIINKEPVDSVDPIINEVLTEVIGEDWRNYDNWTFR